ncbi:heterokaryon incompatibility protein-domain-containing protein [Trichophaea hybrida]|nr:heterokaryon incompatibility protein-domain-containing protein [Trichophaea hybrida]
MQTLTSIPRRLGFHPASSITTPTPPETPLCATCTNISIPSLLQSPTQAPGGRDPAIPHDHLDTLISRFQTCTFCKIICHAIHTAVLTVVGEPPPPPNAPMSLQDFFEPGGKRKRCYLQPFQSGWLLEESRWRKDKSGLKLNYEYRTYRIQVTLREDEEEEYDPWNQPGIQIDPLQRSTAKVKTKAETIVAMIQLLSSDAEKIGSKPLFHGRLVGEDIDLAQLRFWLKTCTEDHTECKRAYWHKVLPPPRNIRVIDIQKSRVIPAKEGCRYIALSYVWGGPQEFRLLKENVEEWTLPGKMPKAGGLPKTIRDAIALVEALGERYLWIDSLCIVQDDIGTQQDQIDQMDRVYGSALFTIVAAAGNSANAGLSGLSPGSRQKLQMVEYVQGLRLAVPLPTLFDSMDSSYINTRDGPIFFTGHQLYYQCDRDVWCEDVYAESSTKRLHKQTYPSLGPHKLVLYPVRSNDQHALKPTIHSAFGDYMSQVAEFTCRNLTGPNDMLDAFTGIANVLRHFPGNRGFIAGLPVMGLDNAILWMPTVAIKRRTTTSPTGTTTPSPFPSWSWAGWSGSNWSGSGPRVLIRRYSFSCLLEDWKVLYLHDGVEQKLSLPPFRDDPSELPSNSPFLTTSLHRALMNSHAFEFWTSVSTAFYITGTCHFRYIWRELIGVDEENSAYCRVCIYDSGSNWAGSLLFLRVDAERILERGDKVWCEFVVVSKGLLNPGAYADANVFGGGAEKVLNVLMVERKGEGKEMERVTWGMLHEDAWNEAGPGREFVRLV